METLKIANTSEKNDEQTKSQLTAEHKIIFHTNIAKALFDGEWKFGRMGLLQFAKLNTTLWKAYNEDDPYAEWYLLKTYDYLQETKEKITGYEKTLSEQLNQLRGIEISIFSNPSPLIRPLRFATPFAFIGAILIEHVDYVVRQLLTLKRIGLIPSNNLTITNLMREVQHVFGLARKWKYTGVTRKAILENNQKAQLAKEILGEIPLAVLNKEVQFTFFQRNIYSINKS